MPFADPVTSVAIMHDEPFILLGCASGNVQVVSMLDSSGSTATAATSVHSLELQPFQGTMVCAVCSVHSQQHVIMPFLLTASCFDIGQA